MKNILVNPVIEWSDEKKVNASSKARIDVEAICKSLGFEVKEVKYKHSNIPPVRAFLKLKSYLKAVKALEENTNIFFQYPVILSVHSFSLLRKILKKKNCKIFFIVHDIESIRYGKNIHEDVLYLNLCDSVILHTEKMKETLHENGVRIPIKIMNFFPYLSNDDFASEEDMLKLRNTICFAGNLGKSVFLGELLKKKYENISWRFYGLQGNLDFDKENNMEYMGKFSPDNVSFIKAGWGLVWDGTSLDTCDGLMGNYLRYNAPHKLSLYLTSGMPVIVWKESGLAQEVEKRGVGISISSILEIEKKLKAISEEDYKKILKNVRKESLNIRKGGECIEHIKSLIS